MSACSYPMEESLRSLIAAIRRVRDELPGVALEASVAPDGTALLRVGGPAGGDPAASIEAVQAALARVDHDLAHHVRVEQLPHTLDSAPS